MVIADRPERMRERGNMLPTDLWSLRGKPKRIP
jgi:hypothetical protein